MREWHLDGHGRQVFELTRDMWESESKTLNIVDEQQNVNAFLPKITQPTKFTIRSFSIQLRRFLIYFAKLNAGHPRKAHTNHKC